MAVGTLLEMAVDHQGATDHQEEAVHKEDLQIILQENREIPPERHAYRRTMVVETAVVVMVVAVVVATQVEEATTAAMTAATRPTDLLDHRPRVRR